MSRATQLSGANMALYPRNHLVASELKDPIWHSLEWQIGCFSSEATTYRLYISNCMYMWRARNAKMSCYESDLKPQCKQDVRLVYAHQVMLKSKSSTKWFLRRGLTTQQTWDVGPTLAYCSANVVSGEPTVSQRWASVSCLPGRPSVEMEQPFLVKRPIKCGHGFLHNCTESSPMLLICGEKCGINARCWH